MSLNKIMIIGRLGQDPTLRHTVDGKPVVNFSVATSHKSHSEEQVEWHRVVVWDKLADNCAKFLSKGKQCYVEGRLQSKTFKDKSGQEKTGYEIVAHTVQFLSERGDGETAREAPRKGSAESDFTIGGTTFPAASRQPMAAHPMASSLDEIPFMRLNEWGM